MKDKAKKSKRSAGWIYHLGILLVLAILAYPIVDARILQKAENQSLEEEFRRRREEGENRSGLSVFDELTEPIGIVRVPSADIALPIFPGLGEYALSKGVGTMGSSDLSGNPGSHIALSSHSGLSASGLFTNLGQTKVGDRFSIENMGGELLTYEVVSFQDDVEPWDSSALATDEHRALATLITCSSKTGINSHRMLVTGELVDRRSAAELEAESGRLILSWYEKAVLLIILLMLLYRLWSFLSSRKRKDVHPCEES